MESLLGKRVLPIVKRDQISVQYASSVLHGSDNMHRSCHMSSEQVSRMVDRAIEELRKRNREQEWIVSAIRCEDRFDLTSDYGFHQGNVSRSDFRLIKD